MSVSLLQPYFFMSKTKSYAQILIGSRLFLTAMAIHLSLRVAPPDLQQGGNSRISYVHVPMPIPILSNFANSPFSTRILFVLETRLPIPSFLESSLTEEIEAREGIPKPTEKLFVRSDSGLTRRCFSMSPKRRMLTSSG